jgi:hypothetical protein
LHGTFLIVEKGSPGLNIGYPIEGEVIHLERRGFLTVRPERRLLVRAVVVSVGMHVAGVSLVEHLQPTPEEVARRVLFVTPTVGGKFVMRAPRVTKRLELRKMPREQGRPVRRGEVAIVAREEGIVTRTAVAQAEVVVERAVRGAGGIGGRGSRLVGIGDEGARDLGWVKEVGVRMQEVEVTKEPERRLNMSLEMLDVNSMDTGRYQAMVIQDPRDKQALKGFIHFARAYAGGSRTTGGGGLSGWDAKSLDILTEHLKYYTGLQADFVGHISFDDERLMEIPFIFGDGGMLTESDIINLTRYLKMGGFIYGGFNNLIEGLEKYAGMVSGRDFYIERLPEDHPMFTCFFDIKGGQPSGSNQPPASKMYAERWNRVEGLWVGGRLCVIAGSLGGWGSLYHSVLVGSDGMRQVQFTINVVVYALTQEGSITHQLMQTVK